MNDDAASSLLPPGLAIPRPAAGHGWYVSAAIRAFADESPPAGAGGGLDETAVFAHILRCEGCLAILGDLLDEEPSCGLIDRLTPRYIAGALTDGELVETIEEHLGDCPFCASAAADERQRQTLAALTGPAERAAAELARRLFDAAIQGVAGARSTLADWLGGAATRKIAARARRLPHEPTREAARTVRLLPRRQDEAAMARAARRVLAPYAALARADLDLDVTEAPPLPALPPDYRYPAGATAPVYAALLEEREAEK